MDAVILGRKVKAARRLRGLKQSELAERVGMRGISSISDLERGKYKPSLDTLEGIAVALNFRSWWFLLSPDESPESVKDWLEMVREFTHVEPEETPDPCLPPRDFSVLPPTEFMALG